MKVAVLDDDFDTLRTLRCLSKLAGHEVTIWNDHAQDGEALAGRLRDAEALVRAAGQQQPCRADRARRTGGCPARGPAWRPWTSTSASPC